MGVILGLGEGGSRLPGFVFNKTMSKYLGQELAEKIRNPVIFQIVSAGKSGTVSPVAMRPMATAISLKSLRLFVFPVIRQR